MHLLTSLFKRLVVCRTLQIWQIDARIFLLTASIAADLRCGRHDEVGRQFMPLLAGRHCATSRVLDAAFIADASSTKLHDGRVASGDCKGERGRNLIGDKRRRFLRLDYEYARTNRLFLRRF